MILLRPALLGVHHAKFIKHCRSKLSSVSGGYIPTGSQSAKYFFNLTGGILIGARGLHPVIRQATAVFVKIVMPFSQRVKVGVKRCNINVRGFFKLFEPGYKGRGIANGHSLVRPPGGQNHHVKRFIICYTPVICQIVSRIISGADSYNIRLLHQPAGAEIFISQPFVAGIPYLFLGGWRNKIVNPEITLKFKMRPVIQGITQKIRHSLRPPAELFPVRNVTGYIIFVYPVAAHRAPLVVITIKPDLRNILPPLILSYF